MAMTEQAQKEGGRQHTWCSNRMGGDEAIAEHIVGEAWDSNRIGRDEVTMR
jgi:hypothetical protein